MRFRTLSEIVPGDPDTWADALFLTIDVDWACDGVLLDTVQLIERAGAKATLFMTHDTPLLERLRSHPLLEWGIHPNFNPLLDGTAPAGHSAERVVERLAAVVPGAASCRSHSLSWGDVISRAVRRAGIRTISNQLVPEQSGIMLQPYADWYGLVHAPYFYQDSACFLFESNTPIDALAVRPGLKIFDFHPIHVFLNSEDQSRYERNRAIYHDAGALLAHRYDGVGTRTSFETLLATGSTS